MRALPDNDWPQREIAGRIFFKRTLPPLACRRRNRAQLLSGCHEVFVERLFLFLLGCLLCLLCFLRFLGHAALRDPQSWLNASRHSTCKHSDYTTILKLIFRASNKVNERHIFATTAKALGLSVQPIRRWQPTAKGDFSSRSSCSYTDPKAAH
jgi:hypothetical protein